MAFMASLAGKHERRRSSDEYGRSAGLHLAFSRFDHNSYYDTYAPAFAHCTGTARGVGIQACCDGGRALGQADRIKTGEQAQTEAADQKKIQKADHKSRWQNATGFYESLPISKSKPYEFRVDR
jgi:hypothetical protein